MDQYMSLKIVVPKGKRSALNASLKKTRFKNYENWASIVEEMLLARKDYVSEMTTSRKEHNTKTGVYIFQMKFLGTYGQLVNIFYTPGLVDALKLVSRYVAMGQLALCPPNTTFFRTENSYYIDYGGEDDVEVNLPPLEDATPLVVMAPTQCKASSQPTKTTKQAKKAQDRANELGHMAYELGEEVRRLKEEVAALQAQITEKESEIRLYEYVQKELEGVCESEEE